MEKLLFINLDAFLFTNANSQFYIKGDLNLTNISNSNSGSVNKNKSIGITVEI